MSCMLTGHLLNQCNILICHHFSVHLKGVYKWNTHVCTFLGFAVHYLVCIAQSSEHIGMGKVFIFARVGWWDIVQLIMFHRDFAFLAVLLSLGQNEDNNNHSDNKITLVVHGKCDQCFIMCHKINQ